MNEVERIIDIMSNADGGCVFCASRLIIRYVEEFGIDKKTALKAVRRASKQHYWKDEKAIKEHFGKLYPEEVK